MELASYLKAELEKRCRKNSRYSLRSFARDLGMDPSNLSRVLSGKFNPATKTQAKILLRLGLKPRAVEKVIKSSVTSSSYFRFESDHFLSVSEWYFDAILELTRLPDFKGNHKWIAAALGISETQVKLSVEKLQDLDLLRIGEDGTWHDESGNLTTYNDPSITTEARRQKQKQILMKSMSSIDTIPIHERDHSSTTLCIQESDLGEVKEMISQFRRELTQYLERSDSKADQVYQLQVSFFPLTRIKKKGEHK